jgi:integrase
MSGNLNINEIQKLYERGVPVSIITEAHKISRQTISKYAKRHSWNHPRYKRVKKFEKIEKSTKRLLKEKLDIEQRLLKAHQYEFQVVRQLLQSAIDHEDISKAALARQISETLVLVHRSELGHSLQPNKPEIKRNSDFLSFSKNLPDRRDPGSTNEESIRHIPELETSLTLLELFESWKRSKSELAPSTASHWRKAIVSFIEFIGHSNAGVIDRSDAIRWREWLLTQNYARKTIESSYLGAPRAIFNYAVSIGALTDNPFRAIQLPKGKIVRKRSKAFSDEEARMILKASRTLKPSREKEHVFNLRKWGPWLAAFTGARINEICQLRKKDVQLKSGIWCIHITPDAGPVKSKLDRIVPLHPQLIAIGFIDFIRTRKDGYLFSHDPNISGARDRSKLIGNWIRSIGITNPDLSPNHAWRHRFKTICRHAGIQTEYQNALTGHVNERNSGLAYGDFPLKALHREICKLPTYSIR